MADYRARFRGLRTRLVILILLAFLPSILLFIAVGNSQWSQAIVQVKENALALARLAAANQAQLVAGTRQLLGALARSDPLWGDDWPACTERLALTLRESPGYTNFSVVDSGGTLLCAAVPITPGMNLNYASVAWVRRVLDTQQFAVGEYVVGRATGRKAVTFGYPMFDEQGQLMRVVGTGADVEGLNQSLAAIQLPDGYTLTVVDAHDTVIARLPSADELLGKPLADVPGQTRGESVHEITGSDGIRRVYAYAAAPVGDRNALATWVSVPLDVALAPYNQALLNWFVGLSVVALLMLVVVSAGAHVLILRPVQSLQSAAKRMRAGDLAARVKLPPASGELHDLAATFDSMADKLQHDQEELERRVAKRTAQLEYANTRLENQIAERREIERRLEASRESLRQLAMRQQNVLEEERSRISREIHDQLGQTLTGLKIDTTFLSRELVDQPAARSRLASMLKLIDEMITLVRRIASELRPGILDDLGLTAAIEWQVQEFGARTKIDCQFQSNIDEDQEPLDRVVATALFRVCQETLTNVARHAGATRVDVALNCDRDGRVLELTIRDDGTGIDESQITQSKSLGLAGMRERVQALNGRLEIRGAPGQGTTVSVVVPLP